MYSNQTQNTPFAWSAPALLVCSIASCLLAEHRKQEDGKKKTTQVDIFKHSQLLRQQQTARRKAGGIFGELL